MDTEQQWAQVRRKVLSEGRQRGCVTPQGQSGPAESPSGSPNPLAEYFRAGGKKESLGVPRILKIMGLGKRKGLPFREWADTVIWTRNRVFRGTPHPLGGP